LRRRLESLFSPIICSDHHSAKGDISRHVGSWRQVASAEYHVLELLCNGAG
jgi:hypothetical protein